MQIFDREFVEKELKWWNIPGVQIGVVTTDDNGIARTDFCGGFGFRDTEHNLEMTGNTLGGIASCTKAFTAAIIATLVDEGRLDWDVPICEYLPEFKLRDRFASEECTLRDMLYHRTGLAGHDAMWPDPDLSTDEYIHRLQYIEPNRPFRSVSQYSNTIYNLIGMIAEKITGIPYNDLLYTRILKPLHMDHTVLSLKEMQSSQDWAVGYFAEDVGTTPPQELRRMEGWEMNGVGSPAAGINSCAKDMLNWLTLHLNDGVYEGKRLISENSMLQMHEAAVKMSPFPWKFPEIPLLGIYGMGWKTSIYRGMPLIYHCGEIEGYCSITAFLPGNHFGMYLLCNRHTLVCPFMAEMLYTAIDRVFAYPETDWADRLHPYAHDFSGSCYTWNMDLTPSSAGLPDTDTLYRENCAGLYRSESYGTLRISYGEPKGIIGVSYMKSGRSPSPASLYLHWKEWILPLENAYGLGPDTFIVPNLKEDTLFYTIPLHFIRDISQNNIIGFTLLLEKEVPPIVFDRIPDSR